eukprot:3302784-Prymnesium_polylepis.1
MVSLERLAVRADKSKDADKVGKAIAANALIRCIETADGGDDVKMMRVCLDGDEEPLGWVVASLKNGQELVKGASVEFPLLKVATKLTCVSITKSSRGAANEELPPGTLVRVIEEEKATDGTLVRALVARNEMAVEPIGWVNVSKEPPSLQQALLLKPLYDLKVHTTKALLWALKNNQAKLAASTDRKAVALPVRAAGKRPANKADENAPSRHRLVEEPGALLLMFNLYDAAFEVKSSSFDLESLPSTTAFDVTSKKRKGKLGVVKMATQLGMTFMQRVSFPDEWLVGDAHGIEHDGWQGGGMLDLELRWEDQVARITAYPWLSYGCAVGTRILMRMMGQAEGQIATVQRIFDDDRCVVRLDGFSKADGTKGETVVDVNPRRVLRTTVPGYPRGTQLLVLRGSTLVDATVLKWLGREFFQVGFCAAILSTSPR